ESNISGRETGMVERDCQHMMLGATRIRLNLPTRQPNERPATLTLTILHRDGRTEERVVAAQEFPLIIPGLKLTPHTVLTGKSSNEISAEFWCKFPTEEINKAGASETQAIRVARFNNLIFARTLAKIAHSFAVAEFGFHSFSPFLRDLILGKSDIAFRFIGGGREVSHPHPKGLPRIFSRRVNIRGSGYVVLFFTLLSRFGVPEYRI